MTRAPAMGSRPIDDHWDKDRSVGLSSTEKAVWVEWSVESMPLGPLSRLLGGCADGDDHSMAGLMATSYLGLGDVIGVWPL